MNVLIIDNNQDFLNRLHQDLYLYFTQFCQRVSFDLYSSQFQSIDFNKEYDYIFIDIDLHEDYSGIDLAKKIKKLNNQANIIFISAHSELIHDSLIIQPLYFIRKNTYEDDLLKFLVIDSRQVDYKLIIELNYKGEKDRVNINDIICIESMIHQLIIRTKNKNYYDNRTLKDFYVLLPKSNFIQIHKSFVINLDYLLDYNSKNVVLTKDIEINIGRSYREEFDNRLKEYIIK